MLRGYDPKKRNSNSRQRKPIIVFALEGNNKTEFNYLKQMAREYCDKISFHYASGNETDPKAMMQALIDKARDLELTVGDYGFSLVDSDCDPRKDKQMHEADVLSLDQNMGQIRQIVSSPCFELWFLLHFEYTTAQFSRSSDVVDRLTSAYVKNYTKGKTDMYALLRDDQAKAYRNASRLMKYCVEKGAKIHTTDFMPSTEMYIVIDCVQELKNSR